MSKSNISKLSDAELCKISNNGQVKATEELISRHLSNINISARKYFIAGAESEDLTQEAMIAFIKAIKEYKAEKKVLFKTYADICIKRRILTAIRNAARQKHTPLNSYVTLSDEFFKSSHTSDPLEAIVEKDYQKELIQNLKAELSSYETDVLELYFEGLSVNEISKRYKKTEKSILNAIGRIRQKACVLL